MSHEPFHEGEIAVQHRAGERAIAAGRGAFIRSTLQPGARSFLIAQRFVAICTAGTTGDLWASVWVGRPGFVSSGDGSSVRLLTPGGHPAGDSDQEEIRRVAAANDPVLPHLRIGSAVGLLAIEFGFRRRLRINGNVEHIAGDAVDVRIRETFGNCPKYIQPRYPRDITGPSVLARAAGGSALEGEARAIIEQADTAFVGSIHRLRGVDVSHRGGRRGFIEVVSDRLLRIPDYAGNSMFMTFGNFEVDWRAALSIVDFERNRLLALAGTAQVTFDDERSRRTARGTGRFWDLNIHEWRLLDLPSDLQWVPTVDAATSVVGPA